jgi:hypothetical protein
MLEYWKNGSWDIARLGKWQNHGLKPKFKWIIFFANPKFHRSTIPLFHE